MENTQENQAVTTVSQDLQDKLKATKALVTAHSLLGVGMFQHRHTEQLNQSLQFLAELHKQILEECLFHPDADKVQELVDYKAEVQKQEQLKQLIEDAKAQSTEEK